MPDVRYASGITAGHHALDSAIHDVGRMGAYCLADRGVPCEHPHGPEHGSIPVDTLAFLVAPVAAARRSDRVDVLVYQGRVINYSRPGSEQLPGPLNHSGTGLDIDRLETWSSP